MITLLQAAQIEVLREQGMGYRNIATELGITRDAVRNYCRSHELAGDRTKKKAPEKKQDPEKCAWCGESFEQNDRGRKKRFCSSECRLSWWNENRASLKKRARVTYKEGDKVSVKSGPWEDTVGTVTGVDEKEGKITLAVEMFMRPVSIELPIGNVIAA